MHSADAQNELFRRSKNGPVFERPLRPARKGENALGQEQCEHHGRNMIFPGASFHVTMIFV